MARSFRVDPAYLESIESGLLAQMAGKNPAYLDWLSYPYDEASFTTVDEVISGKQSKDGYLTKDCCTWQFNAYEELSLNSLVDVDLSGNPEIVLPPLYDPDLRGSAGLVYNADTQMWEPQLISAQNFRYFYIDSDNSNWSYAHPGNFAFYKGPWDSIFLPLLGQPFDRPYYEWSFDKNDSNAGRRILRWLDSGPTWSDDFDTYGGPVDNILTNVNRVMKRQQFARRPMASWDSGILTGLAPSYYHFNSSPWHIRGTQTGSSDPLTSYSSYDFLDFFASGKYTTRRFGFGEPSPIQRLQGILHNGASSAGMHIGDVLFSPSGSGLTSYNARNPGDFYGTRGLTYYGFRKQPRYDGDERWYDDDSTQLWPLAYGSSRWNTAGPSMDGVRGFVHTSQKERLADSSARTRLTVMARMADKSTDSTTAAKATFNEITTRLDLLYEVADWAHAFDAGRLGPHSRINIVHNYLEFDDQNSIIPSGVSRTNLDTSEARERNLMVRYNETGWGGVSSMSGRSSIRTDELGKAFAHGENIALKAWYPNLFRITFTLLGGLRIPGMDYMSGLGTDFREPNNWAANSGDFSLSVNESGEWSSTFGTNVSQVYVNWIRPMPMPSAWREDGLLGSGNDNTYFIDSYSSPTNMSGPLAYIGSSKSPFDELLGTPLATTGRTREYVSITIYWDRPQPSNMYDVVAFPGTDMERSVPCPMSDWRTLQAIDGTDNTGYPLKDDNIVDFFKEWGYNDEFWSWNSSTSEVEKVFDLAEAVSNREVFPESLTDINYVPLGDNWFSSDGRFPAKSVNDCWMPGPIFETVKLVNTKYQGQWGSPRSMSSRHMFFTKSRQENVDKVISTSDAQPISGPVLGKLVHPTGSNQFRLWDYDKWVHLPKNHPAVLDYTTATPSHITDNAWTSWGGGLAYEPLLRLKSNGTYRSVSTAVGGEAYLGRSFDPHVENYFGFQRLCWTRCLAKEKAYCTILVPKDWWDLQLHSGKTVPFQARHLRPKGMGIGLTSPSYIFPDFTPAGMEGTLGFLSDDRRKIYTWYGYAAWPESFKILGYDGLFPPYHEQSRDYLKPNPTAAYGGDDIQYGWMDLKTAADMGYIYPYDTENRSAKYRLSHLSSEDLWYGLDVDHWGTLRNSTSFKNPNAYIDEWAKRQFIEPSSGWGDLTLYEPDVSTIRNLCQYGSRQNITKDEKGIPRFVKVSAVTFPLGVKFKAYSTATDPCQGNEIILQIWGTNDPSLLDYQYDFNSQRVNGFYNLANSLRRSGSDPLGYTSVSAGITSTSTNPNDWEIPPGTTITFPSPIYAVVPDRTWVCPGLAMAFSSPTPGRLDSNGKNARWFQIEGPAIIPEVLSSRELGQDYIPGEFEPSEIIWSYRKERRDDWFPRSTLDLAVIWTTDADKSGLVDRDIDLGCAGEGWGYNPNDFGRHGTPLWAGEEEDPWLDPEGILRTQNQEDSGFGASNTPCSD